MGAFENSLREVSKSGIINIYGAALRKNNNLKRENARLQKALQFYTDASPAKIDRDEGFIAREALKKLANADS